MGRACYTDSYPFERGPDAVLMNLAQIPGSDTTTGCTGIALLAPLLNIVSCLEHVISYPASCWHPSHLMMVHHVVHFAPRENWAIFYHPSADSQLCSNMPFLQSRIYIEPSGSCMWGCSKQCLSTLGTVQSLLPPEWGLCPGHSVVPFSEWLHPSQLWLQLQQLVPAWRLPLPRFCGSG
jgi:hypothetical protein